MKLRAAALLLICTAVGLQSQVPPVLQSPQIIAAKLEIERVAALVEAGAIPRSRMEEAQEKLADAQDDLILAHSLYGELPVKDLSDEMAAEMVAAAQRRVERQIRKVEATRKLVNDGVIAGAALQPLDDELSSRRMNLSLAHSRSKLIGELVSMNRFEQSMKGVQQAVHLEPFTDYTVGGMAHYAGGGGFLVGKELKIMELAFEKRFEFPLPISADGQTATHNALGFDHRGRVDVAVNPSDPAGVWIRRYLEQKGIPYYAFYRAIPGKATGAHIHIGPGSNRLHNAD